MLCYCEATQKKFREWLKAKYGTLRESRQSMVPLQLRDWDNVHPPRNFSGYPESLDWLEFRIDNVSTAPMAGRSDPKARQAEQDDRTRRSVNTGRAARVSANNEWRSAAEVDVWGFTWVASRKGSEPWKQFHAVDLVRAGSRGKPFWHAEAQAGPLWMQPQVTGGAGGRTDYRREGCSAVESDLDGGWRHGNSVSTGRPLLDGPLFGAFGPMGLDGSITPRAEMAGQVARWANSQKELCRGPCRVTWHCVRA